MANRYWVGADGNWSDTAHWSTSSGGASGASIPGTGDTAIFDANSNTGTTAWTATVDTAFTITTLTISSIDAQLTIASAGNLTCSTSTGVTAGTTTLLINGNASLGAVTLTSGTLTIGASSTVTMSTFTSTSTSTRTLDFANQTSSVINLTGNAATIWNCSTAGVSTTASRGTVNCTYSGATGTRTIVNNHDTGNNFVNFKISAGTDIVSFSGTTNINGLDFTGFSGSWTNTALTSNGSLTVSTGMTVSAGTNAFTFAGAGNNTITTNGKTLDFPVTISGAGTWTLQDNCTVGSTRTFTLTQGKLALVANTLSTGLFNSSGTSTREITRTSGNITVTGNAATVLTLTGSGATYASGTIFSCNYSGATGTRTINSTDTTTSISITAGTDTIAFTASNSVNSLDFSGFSGTWSNIAISIYGNLIISTGMTVSAGTNAVTFAATTSQTITTNGKTLDFPVTFNGVSGSWALQDNMTVGSTRTTTLTNGTIDLTGNSGNWTLSTGLFASSNSNTRSIAFGTGQITLTGNAATIWNLDTATNFSYTGTPKVVSNYSGATGNRTIVQGKTAGGAEANSVSFYFTGGTDTITTPGGNLYVKTLDFSGFSGTLASFVLFIYGDLVISSGMTLTAGSNLTTFGATSGIKKITTNGKTLDFPVTFDGVSGTWALQDNMTVGSTRTTTLTNGTIDLTGNSGNWTLSTGLFASANSNTRSIAFGTGNITLTAATASTIWNMGTTTGFTYTGTPTVNTTGGGANLKTIDTSGTLSESNAVSFNIQNSAGTVLFTTASYIKDLTFNNASVGFANSTGTLTIYGNLTVTALASWAGTGAITFAATSSKTIDTGGKTITNPLTFDGVGGTWTLQANCTLGNTLTTTLTNGTLALGTYTYSTGKFVSSNSNVRSINFGTGKIQLTENAISGNFTIWDTSTSTNFSVSGTPVVDATGSGGTNIRTITTGTLSEANAISFNITSGSDTIAASSVFKNLNFTGFTGTLSNAARTIYGNLIVVAGMTLTAGANATTFGATSGTQDITSNGKTLDFPITIDGVGGTVSLQDALTVGSTRTITLTNGTFNANNFNVTTGLFSSNNSNTRTITMGSGTWTLSGTGTVWNLGTTTGLTFNKNTANIVLSNTSTSARTFAGGGLIYNNLTIGGTTGTSVLTVTGSNTFATLASTKTVAHTITLTSGTTTTVSGWTITGTAGNIVTLNASTPGSQATLTKTGGGTINVNYMNIKDSAATPSNTWYALTTNGNVNSGNNTGWIFSTGGGNFLMFFNC